MKKLLSLAALAASAILASPAAQALTFEGALTQGATLVTPYVETGHLSFDVDFANTSSVFLDFRVDEEDLLQPLTLNAILRNYTGSGIGGYVLSFDKGSFDTVGSVTRQFGGTTQVLVQGGNANLTFSPSEFLDVEIGNALGTTPSAADWTLKGLQAGDRISLSISAVPEPTTWALLAAGLVVTGVASARRTRRHQGA